MKNTINVEIEIEHNESSSTQEICDALIMQLEGSHEPDDLGITKSQVINISCDDLTK